MSSRSSIYNFHVHMRWRFQAQHQASCPVWQQVLFNGADSQIIFSFRKAFSKFYHRHSELIVKYNIWLKTLLQLCISEPICSCDLVYKLKQIVGKPNFSDQFKKIIKRYIKVGYNLDVMRQSACLVLNPITVYSHGFLFNCTTVSQASDSMTALT